MTFPDAVTALANGARNGAPSPDQNEHGRREGIFDHFDEPGHVGREEPARLPHDHDALVDQEGRGQAGIHHRPHVDVVPRTTTDLLDHEGVVALAHHLGQQPAHLLGHERRVIALDEIRRCAHSAALIRPLIRPR